MKYIAITIACGFLGHCLAEVFRDFIEEKLGTGWKSLAFALIMCAILGSQLAHIISGAFAVFEGS